ncbi:TniQ family protein [Variovorax sp. J31P207]|uniref:TniQ family protein n=1 Tax=Variovorax sp. J31P207 TaxID=3053510 RepID=UPI0033657DB9
MHHAVWYKLCSQHTQNRSLTFLPWIEDDETAYSFCSTTHRLSGSANGETTSLNLFGIRSGAWRHAQPHSLPRLPLPETDTPEGAFRWAARHTVAGLYIPFMTPSARHVATAAWTAREPTRSLNYRMPGSFWPQHPLKWCPDCVSEDIARLGRPYWHVSHQLPTTWLCVQHRRALFWVPTRYMRWLLPTDVLCRAKRRSLGDDCAQLGNLLASLGHVVLSSDGAAVDLSLAQSRAAERLLKLGVRCLSSVVRDASLDEWFRTTETSKFLNACPAWLSNLAQGTWISQCLDPSRKLHPVLFLVLWSSLQWRSSELACAALVDAAWGNRLASRAQTPAIHATTRSTRPLCTT